MMFSDDNWLFISIDCLVCLRFAFVATAAAYDHDDNSHKNDKTNHTADNCSDNIATHGGAVTHIPVPIAIAISSRSVTYINYGRRCIVVCSIAIVSVSFA